MLTDVMAALQTIADAVTEGDGRKYLNAVHRARELGCTQEQITDAYHHRNQLRMLNNRPPVSFDVAGDLNYYRAQTNDIAGAESYAIKIEQRDGYHLGTKWLSCSADQFRRIADILSESR